MEFLDESDNKPRFLFQSKQLPHSSDPDQFPHSYFSSLHKPTLFISLLFSIIIFSIALFYFNDLEPLKSLLLWLSLSLFLGPFAPPAITAGDIRVGLGPPIKEPPEKEIYVETKEKFSRKSIKRTPHVNPVEAFVGFNGFEEKSQSDENEVKKMNVEEKKYDEEREWSDGDEELLRKLMGKHPVGKPGRWEAIAEGFKGKHKVESVIAKAKELGDKKIGDQDSYKKFLKNRKPVDQRVVEELENETNVNQSVEEGKKESGWSAGEDLTLLSALKTFPKEVAMRWEKIAASLPGKTKSGCMKRMTELKKDFRTSKGQAS